MSTTGHKTGFYWDERCFWHAGGNYALTLPIGGLVQPLAAGGLPESPETKRRLRNLMSVTGIIDELHEASAPEASRADLLRVHPASYLDRFKEMSDAGGGELGLRTPFAQGGYEIAALSAGLAKQALLDVMRGTVANAYALSRPPGHHCLPDWPNGFCLMANIAIAIEAAQAEGLAGRVAVVDWDVHHGNGTEAIYYDRDDVLTISVHQENNYPLDTGATADKGRGKGEGYNINLPLPSGVGHTGYVEVMERVVVPALERFRPDVIIVACGFDAGIYDPIARMLCTAETFGEMTRQLKAAAERLCEGKLVMVHEGGYSEVYVPFCGHRVIEALSGSARTAADPMAETVRIRQPNARMDAFVSTLITELAEEFAGP
ncbi:class II histone deacetylase [Pseudooceanicola sediminis]|uniref:Class II histone deacetylase n=1 Tax=Pseudooceanicola sediminis TaxID=2211117 RepID=A0A399IWL1_9RHOB|nr:class II histone deacetylase [Pseudooceanicola sediminis]KAA2312373.1 class II histone deacetylase [Puniceibacterium sp. HSS470]RII37421.1 class II histone deacetylase [Pseudooceanicola sediminis]|tara:strand:- start:1150 stop:2274 length:1125 start_codon:yes stop_codon:yes gene_type:complete